MSNNENDGTCVHGAKKKPPHEYVADFIRELEDDEILLRTERRGDGICSSVHNWGLAGKAAILAALKKK